MTASLYWISTALLSLLYLSSATLHIVKNTGVRKAVAELGYPTYLVPVLIAVKLLAVVAVVLRFSVPLADLAYAGMFYHLVLSALAHIGVRKPRAALPALIGLLLLTTSFLTQNVAREVPSPYGDFASIHQSSKN